MDKVDYPVKAVFIPGQRGTEVLLDPLNNKMTKKSNEANGKAIYECSKFKVTLDVEAKMIVSARGEHSHDSDLMKAWVKKEQDKVVMGVYKNPSVPPRAIFQEIQNRVMSSPATSSGMALLPKASSLARQVQRKRKAERGPEGNLPTSWQDMIIPLQYHHTTGGENSSSRRSLKLFLSWGRSGSLLLPSPSAFSEVPRSGFLTALLMLSSSPYSLR